MVTNPSAKKPLQVQDPARLCGSGAQIRWDPEVPKESAEHAAARYRLQRDLLSLRLTSCEEVGAARWCALGVLLAGGVSLPDSRRHCTFSPDLPPSIPSGGWG